MTLRCASLRGLSIQLSFLLITLVAHFLGKVSGPNNPLLIFQQIDCLIRFDSNFLWSRVIRPIPPISIFRAIFSTDKPIVYLVLVFAVSKNIITKVSFLCQYRDHFWCNPLETQTTHTILDVIEAQLLVGDFYFLMLH